MIRDQDAPLSGADPVWTLKHEKGTGLALKLALNVYKLLGRTGTRLLLFPVALYYWLTDHPARRSSLDYLRRVVPEVEGSARYILSYRQFLEFSRALLDKVAVWLGAIQLGHLSFEGKDVLRNLLDQGQGAVVLSAHLGNIEVVRAISKELRGVKVTPIMFTEHHPVFPEFLKSASANVFESVIFSQASGPELVIALEEITQRGEVVAMLADRVTKGAPEKHVTARFFGSEAQFPAGPFIVASLLRCPVFLIFCFSEGESYRIIFETFADSISIPRRERGLHLEKYVQQYAARLEHYCRKYPTQWYNFYPFWRDP